MQSAILQSSAQIDSLYTMFMRMLLSVFVFISADLTLLFCVFDRREKTR